MTQERRQSDGTVDVAVIGSGPAGASIALQLARSRIQTLVVERGSVARDRPGESLSPAATPLIARLGLLSAFLETRPAPCHGNRSSWSADGALTDHDFIRDRNGHGWHIDRPRFGRMLIAQARLAGASCLTGARLSAVDEASDFGWTLRIETAEGESEIQARFVVDASGRSSVVARALAARRQHADRLTAVTAFLETSGSPCPDSTTLVEAVDYGWWYSAVIPDGRLAVSLMSDPDILARLGATRTPSWLALLAATEHSRERVLRNGYGEAAELEISPAGSSLLQPCAGDGWLAAGDAAASFDPLTSCGIATALATGVHAATAVREYLGGNWRAPIEYGEQVALRYHLLLPLLRAYYAAETRWSDAPFWSRRLSPLPDEGVHLAGATLRG